jgi:hypothetical protein
LVTGVLTDDAAGRAGLSLVWSHEPTEGCLHRLTRLTRQAYGRAGVDVLRHRILASSTEAAAESSVGKAMAVRRLCVAGAHQRITQEGRG